MLKNIRQRQQNGDYTWNELTSKKKMRQMRREASNVLDPSQPRAKQDSRLGNSFQGLTGDDQSRFNGSDSHTLIEKLENTIKANEEIIERQSNIIRDRNIAIENYEKDIYDRDLVIREFERQLNPVIKICEEELEQLRENLTKQDKVILEQENTIKKQNTVIEDYEGDLEDLQIDIKGYNNDLKEVKKDRYNTLETFNNVLDLERQDFEKTVKMYKKTERMHKKRIKEYKDHFGKTSERFSKARTQLKNLNADLSAQLKFADLKQMIGCALWGASLLGLFAYCSPEIVLSHPEIIVAAAVNIMGGKAYAALIGSIAGFVASDISYHALSAIKEKLYKEGLTWALGTLVKLELGFLAARTSYNAFGASMPMDVRILGAAAGGLLAYTLLAPAMIYILSKLPDAARMLFIEFPKMCYNHSDLSWIFVISSLLAYYNGLLMYVSSMALIAFANLA